MARAAHMTGRDRERARLMVVVALGVVGVALAVWAAGLLSSFEGSSIDARFAIRGRLARPPGIVIVGIDSSTLNEQPGVRLGRFPYPRRDDAAVIRNLLAAGARAVALDLEFVQQTDTADDNALVEAVTRAHGKVVLADLDVGPHGAPDVLGGGSSLTATGARAGFIGVAPDADAIWRSFTYDGFGADPVADCCLASLAVQTVEAATHRMAPRSLFPGGSAPVDFVGPAGSIREIPFWRVSGFAPRVQGHRLDLRGRGMAEAHRGRGRQLRRDARAHRAALAGCQGRGGPPAPGRSERLGAARDRDRPRRPVRGRAGAPRRRADAARRGAAADDPRARPPQRLLADARALGRAARRAARLDPGGADPHLPGRRARPARRAAARRAGARPARGGRAHRPRDGGAPTGRAGARAGRDGARARPAACRPPGPPAGGRAATAAPHPAGPERAARRGRAARPARERAGGPGTGGPTATGADLRGGPGRPRAVRRGERGRRLARTALGHRADPTTSTHPLGRPAAEPAARAAAPPAPAPPAAPGASGPATEPGAAPSPPAHPRIPR